LGQLRIGHELSRHLLLDRPSDNSARAQVEYDSTEQPTPFVQSYKGTGLKCPGLFTRNIPNWAGFLYLVIVFDLYLRRVVG
jgi:transposase InsO family protein